LGGVSPVRGEGYAEMRQGGVSLLYLILTYSNPGDVVLDTTMGSGTTAVAALETGRRFIGFETDERYFEAANSRVKSYYHPLDSNQNL